MLQFRQDGADWRDEGHSAMVQDWLEAVSLNP